VIVVVSAHLDDAVFSCWSVIAGSDDVRVVTVFTAVPPPGKLFKWDRDTDAPDSATRMRERLDEDRAALAVAGRTPVHLGLLEPYYGGGRVWPDDLRPQLEQAALVYAPAAVGLKRIHPDHGDVRDAVLAVRPDAVLYADQPYCGFRPDIRPPAELGNGYAAELVSLSPEERTRKARAVNCYAGELAKLESMYGAFAEPEHLKLELYWRPGGDR
jgi:LmbE family N-acetylglucosaminyl deacetylase